MKKADIKHLFQSIEGGDIGSLTSLLDQNPDAMEVTGEHNRLVRDKTPLMYAFQCENFEIAHLLIHRGANVSAKMTGGPQSSVISLCCTFAKSARGERYESWVAAIKELLDGGANPTDGLWPTCNGHGQLNDRDDIAVLLLARGANADAMLGNSGNTVRQLLHINSLHYSASFLALFAIVKEG